MVLALQDPRVAQALRLALAPREGQRSDLDAELQRVDFVTACRNVFAGIGVWSPFGQAVSADALRAGLVHMLQDPHMVASLSTALRRRIRPRQNGVYHLDLLAIEQLARDIYTAFADTSRGRFAGERKAKTPKALAAMGRRRQRPIFLEIAGEDLAMSEKNAEQLDEGDHEESVLERMELDQRHYDVQRMSDAAWEVQLYLNMYLVLILF